MVSARRSIRKQFWVVFGTLVVLSPLSSAQRPVVPPAHSPVIPVHVSPPPVFHAPVSQTPIMHAPVMYAPIATPPRHPIVLPAGTPGIATVRPPMRPIRPVPPLVLVYSPPFALGGPFWRFNLCWWATCDLFFPWTFGYTTVSSPGPTNYVSQVYETPVYVYGYEREDTPQLYLKDGTILNVTDYWLVDDQLHFTVIEQAGTKPVEQSMPFSALDLQKTVDANTAKGFRFVLRNEPVEQYLRDHPEGPPPDVVQPHEQNSKGRLDPVNAQ
jgi:hypothetical protein